LPRTLVCGVLFYYLKFLRQKADMPTLKHRRQLTTCQKNCHADRRVHSLESNCQPLEIWVSLHHQGISTLPRQRVLASPLTRPGRKICPTPLARALQTCQGSSNFQLHSLSSRVSVALVVPKFRDLIHLRSLNRATFGLKPLYREYS
jgi:hypothetical protein